jgi:hypothetical protein
MAVDDRGNLLIADGNNAVRIVTPPTDPALVLSTLAVIPPGSAGGDPRGIVMDAARNLYVTDGANHRVLRIDAATAAVTTIAGTGTQGGTGDGGPATLATLSIPIGIGIDAAANLYIADSLNNRIRRIDSTTGVITTVAGTGTAGYAGDGGPATAARLMQPSGLFADPSGNLYVVDTGNYAVRRVDAASGLITTVAGNGVKGNGCTDGEGVAATLAPLSSPHAVALDGAGTIFIADGRLIRKIAAGVITTFAGPYQCTARPGQEAVPAVPTIIGLPAAVATDRAGNLYFADGTRVRRVNPGGLLNTIAGGVDAGLAGDGSIALAGQLSDPVALVLDDAGRVYIADPGNSRIRKATISSAPYITRHPAGATVRAGVEVTFSAAANGGSAATVRWQASADRGVTWANIQGATTPDYALVSNVADNFKRFRAVFTNAEGQAFTYAAALTVLRPTLTDFDGDSRGDLMVWRPGSGTWFSLRSTTDYSYASAMGTQWGNAAAGDIPLAGDIDGDGIGDLIVWRASTGTWYWLTSSTGYSYAAAGARQWGNQALGDMPLTADMDGDGRSDLVVWRASTGTWYWLSSSSGYDTGFARSVLLGDAGDRPFLGDVDGDGRADPIVWRPSNGTWYWLNSVDGFQTGSAKQWGNEGEGDIPLVGDIDGDGLVDLVVWRAPIGKWLWLSSSSGYDYGTAVNFNGLQWGSQSEGDIPLLTDLDGDGRADFTVWRTSTGTWYWVTSSTRYDYARAGARQWGSAAAGDVPIVR